MTAELPPATDRTPLLRRPVFWIVTAIAVLVVALVTTASSILVNNQGSPDAEPGTTAGATAPSTATTPTQDTSSSPTPSPVPPVTVVAIPTDCSDIYTKDWTPEMHGMVLNPPWASDPAKGMQYASNDDALLAVLETTTDLKCKWGRPLGASDAGIITNLAALTAEQQADAIAHAQDSGYSCYEELGGTRCVTETEPSPDGQAGESHFFRDGVWVATYWMIVAPDGYTHDIVAAVFSD